ncbi:MAG: zinc-ribbon domain-containing protein [Janthinobacterium lividum]
MRITCPACNASYEVPDAMLVAGRAVRCARCLREWEPPAPVHDPAHPAPASSPPEPAAPEPAPFEVDGFALPPPERPRFTDEDFERAPAPRPPDDAHAWRDVLLAHDEARPPAATGRRDGWVGWLASLVLLAALAGAAIAWRGPVQRAWPPSARVYAALGLRQARPEALPLDSAKGSPLESHSR